ncbi:MAG: TrlF family AAA-like ATPase [Candidatus Brocadiia bacterium]
MSTYRRGSVWRKWDLHVHTPYSVLCNNFAGSSRDEQLDNYVDRLEELDDVSVLGLTDYYTIDGYFRVKEQKEQGRLDNIDLLMPNLELRVLPVTNVGNPLNLHILFAPDIAHEVENRFLSELTFEYQQSTYHCTRPELIRLGQDYQGNDGLDERAAFRVGAEQFKVKCQDIKEIVRSNADLREQTLIGIPNSSYDGASGFQSSSLTATRRDLYQMADFIFSGNPNDRKYFLGRGPDDVEEVEARYGNLKPCLHGSDAHSLDAICQPDLGRFTWIKADPTFDGLCQVMIEPESRVYIGEEPPLLERIRKNPTKHIDSVQIRKRDESDLEESWFDQHIDINPGLTAVIGPKGSCKTALADIIALLGNSHSSSFGFLNEEKFKRPPSNKAQHFEGSIRWVSNAQSQRRLHEDADPDAPERVKYLPQEYFEKICNELTDVEESEFDRELKNVIFSHIPDADRLGAQNLDDLAERKRQSIKAKEEDKRADLRRTNEHIANLEKLTSSEHKDRIAKKLQQKREELEAHVQAEPQPPAEVGETNDAQESQTAQRIEQLRELRKKYSAKIEEATNRRTLLSNKFESLSALRSDVQRFVSRYDDFLSDNKKKAEAVGIDLSDVLSLSYNLSFVDNRISEVESQLAELRTQLDPDVPRTKAYVLRGVDDKIEELRDDLQVVERARADYRENHEEWDRKREALIGDDDTPETIQYLKRRLAYVEKEAEEELEGFRVRQRNLCGEIYELLSEEADILRELYRPVQTFIADRETASEQLAMEFGVSIVVEHFAEKFFAMVNQQAKGTFRGIDAGRQHLRGLMDETDFNDKQNVICFATKVYNRLHADYRGQNSEQKKTCVPDQLTQDYEPNEIYDLVFGLNYLRPTYMLSLDGKSLPELSPGERGALLLLFFLFVDRSDIPLILDQPEENLDNESVYEVLVPCIKEARKRRQIILVTHNPNLAIAGDADQIVHANLKPEDGNRVTYTTGSIEASNINKFALDILEGTRPAFDKRDAKYID